MLSQPIRKRLLQFCAAELDAASLQAWLCAADDAEAQLGPSAYLELISADHHGQAAEGLRELCKSLLEHHRPGSLNRYRVARTLQAMLQNDEALLPGLRTLVRLRREGCGFIPIEFVGFESETDDLPGPAVYHRWNDRARADVLGQSLVYQRKIKDAAQSLLDELRRAYPDDT